LKGLRSTRFFQRGVDSTWEQISSDVVILELYEVKAFLIAAKGVF
jgi:hypothetical protein